MWHDQFKHCSTQSAISDQNALGQPWVDQKSKTCQNHPKTTFFLFLHQTLATLWFSSTWSCLTKFDPRLTLRGIENPNFDPTVRLGWDQCYYKFYWILFPITIHGSKSELKRLRYLENREKCISSLPDPITCDPTVRFPSSLVFQKLHIHMWPLELKGHFFIINTPRPPSN